MQMKKFIEKTMGEHVPEVHALEDAVEEEYDSLYYDLKDPNWIPGLAEKVYAMDFEVGDKIYIQFNNKLKKGFLGMGKKHIYGDDAIYGSIIDVGKNINYRKNPDFDKEVKAYEKKRVEEAKKEWHEKKAKGEEMIPMEEYLDLVRTSVFHSFSDMPTLARPPDVNRGIYALQDPELSRSWRIKFREQDGTRILIKGYGLTLHNTGLDTVPELIEFDQPSKKHLKDTILFHTGYLQAVNADIFLNRDIKKGMEQHERKEYVGIRKKLNRML